MCFKYFSSSLKNIVNTIIWKCHQKYGGLQNKLVTKNRVTQLTVVCICSFTFTEWSIRIYPWIPWKYSKESVNSESWDISLSDEKKGVCENAVEDYVNYVSEKKNELINCLNKTEMRAYVINFRRKLIPYIKEYS